MEAINLTQSQLAERFRIEVQEMKKDDYMVHLREVLRPQGFGTEHIDFMVSKMKPHTNLDELSIKAVLDWEILFRAGEAHLYTLL